MRRPIATLAGWLAMAFSTATAQTPPSFIEFRGVSLGSTPEEISARIPDSCQVIPGVQALSPLMGMAAVDYEIKCAFAQDAVDLSLDENGLVDAMLLVGDFFNAPNYTVAQFTAALHDAYGLNFIARAGLTYAGTPTTVFEATTANETVTASQFLGRPYIVVFAGAKRGTFN